MLIGKSSSMSTVSETVSGAAAREKYRSFFFNWGNEGEEWDFGFPKVETLKGLRDSIGEGYVEGLTMALMLGWTAIENIF